MEALARDGHSAEFIKDQHRHCKTILVFDASKKLMEANKVPRTLPAGEPDPGLIFAGTDAAEAIDAFMAALTKHRHPVRDADRPTV